jgi:hypothetical protein
MALVRAPIAIPTIEMLAETGLRVVGGF